MKEELDKQLCERYPEIFANRYKDMQVTAMCWGFECGNGWYNIINSLCNNIQSHIDWKAKQGVVVEQVVADQVKEKFGTLHFYYSGGDDTIAGMVRMAESMSAVTCEDCGNPGETQGGGWLRTICKPCDERRKNRHAINLQKEVKHDVNYKFIDEDSGAHD